MYASSSTTKNIGGNGTQEFLQFEHAERSSGGIVGIGQIDETGFAVGQDGVRNGGQVEREITLRHTHQFGAAGANGQGKRRVTAIRRVPVFPLPNKMREARSMISLEPKQQKSDPSPIHRYPDATTCTRTSVRAGNDGRAMDQIFVGLGSSEIIDLASRICWAAEKPEPRRMAVTRRFPWPFAPAAPNWCVCRSVISRSTCPPLRTPSWPTAKPVSSIWPNPNNPTGTAFGMFELQEFLRTVPADVLGRAR